MVEHLGDFVQGMSAMACIVIMLFFLHFWRRTSDRLFLIFAIAFSLMCLTRVLAVVVGGTPLDTGAAAHSVEGYQVYLVRFLAFLLILAAIIDKNR